MKGRELKEGHNITSGHIQVYSLVTEQSLFGIPLSSVYLILEIVSLAISIAIALAIKLPRRFMAIVRPVTIASPVFDVGHFGIFTEQEVSIDYDKQLKGVPIFVHNRGHKPCVIDALWIEPCVGTFHGFQETIPRIPLIPNYLESNTVSSDGGQVEIRAIPDTTRYLEKICKEWDTDFCRICVRALPYGGRVENGN
jgi:hypothetical protein